MPDPTAWHPKTAQIPAAPGVYRFWDADGRVIYVGKAISLRARLSSYFQDPVGLHPRTRLMVATAVRVEWTLVRNELEALQLEYSWIKQYEPRFNVKYRDDKSYPWLCVTWSEEFPRVFVGRGAKRPGWRYFGPYAEAWAIRDSIDALLTVFPMRSCSAGVFRSAKATGRPCLMGDIDKCAAPCVGRISPDDHRAIVTDLCTALAGRTAGFMADLEAAMAAHAEALEFERAGVIRDKLAALRRVRERNAIVLEDSTDLDLIALALDPLEVAVEVFQVRSGRLVVERGWVADRPGGVSVAESSGEAPEDLPELIEAFLLQIYSEVGDEAAERKRLIPREILVPELPTSPGVLAELLSATRGAKVRIRVPRRGDKQTLMATAQRNAAETLLAHKTRRASDLTTRSQALDELAQALGLPSAPLRIECYDISHLQGTNTVASMVVFEDGLARKSEYRHFTITSVASDDVGAMAEVLSRRCARLIADEAALREADPRSGLVDATTRQARRFSYPPALIVVDGAAAQVAAARRTLDDLGFSSIAVCGLAKRLEEVWLANEAYPVILSRSSQALYLLQRLRDEAHRFAISYHRQKRSRSMVESLLDGVPGLGEVRRKALLRAFGSLKKLRAASAEQIGAVPGFGPRLAQAVVAALAQGEPAPTINLTTGEISD